MFSMPQLRRVLPLQLPLHRSCVSLSFVLLRPPCGRPVPHHLRHLPLVRFRRLLPRRTLARVVLLHRTMLVWCRPHCRLPHQRHQSVHTARPDSLATPKRVPVSHKSLFTHLVSCPHRYHRQRNVSSTIAPGWIMYTGAVPFSMPFLATVPAAQVSGEGPMEFVFRGSSVAQSGASFARFWSPERRIPSEFRRLHVHRGQRPKSV